MKKYEKNQYKEMRERHQQIIHSLPIRFAFTDDQFKKAMESFGLTENDTDQVVSIFGAGDIVLEKDVPYILEQLKKNNKELQEAIAADKTGDGFIFDMFFYELGNHEYTYTRDVRPTLETLGITEDDLEKNPALLHGLQKACKEQDEWGELYS